MKWSVYIIEADDQSFYTGISTDVYRRFEQHLNGNGAKYFNTCKPNRIIYQENNHTRSSASKREAEIKNLSHKEKKFLISRAQKDI